ncbi:MAG: pyridoxamine 5'-phosphate oxidase family protein [Phycisphaerae bacterium]|nr:pyridoxamine 5'-phosphate oxidase family protein [Phycisphaerae bacterium]
MTLEQVKEFIKQTGWGFLATTDGHKVGVRPMGAVAWKGNCFLCATFAASDKIAQLKKVPYAEYCFSDSAGKHVRIAGSCMVSTDNAEKLWLYKEIPGLKDHVKDPASPDYVIIKMTPDNIRIMDSADMKYMQVELK